MTESCIKHIDIFTLSPEATVNKATHYLIFLSSPLCSTMRGLSTRTTGMGMDSTAGPQVIGLLASSILTERKDMDNSCFLMEPSFR